jgi:hypothetical protein
MAEIFFSSDIADNVKGKVVVMTGTAQHFATKLPSASFLYLLLISVVHRWRAGNWSSDSFPTV